MSDAWDRCRQILRVYLGEDDWTRSIQTMRGWLDAHVLYLWVDRDSHDHRALANPARNFDSAIRRAMSEVTGRPPSDICYLERPPRHEHIINSRRMAQHRERAMRQTARDHAEVMAMAMEECQRLLDDPDELRLSGSAGEQRVRLTRIIMDRAKRRLAARSLLPAHSGRRPPPSDAPPWPPSK